MTKLDPTGDQNLSKMPRLIFVSGPPHSGTTLVATILGVNSKCFLVPSESGAYSKQHIHTLRKAFVRKVSSIESDFIVEKSPEHIFNIDKMQEDFPDAGFVVVMRNPIDIVGSLLRTYGDFNLSLYTCSDYLSACTAFSQYPGVNIVEYEDIVTNFDETISSLCQKLDLDFEDRMKNFHQYSPLWFEKFRDSDDLFKRRSEQMKRPLFDGRGVGKTMLNSDQINQVIFDCQEKYEILTNKVLTP